MARLLDLFCGAGGAAMGYRHAGFTEIVGVDIKPQPRFPFEFWCCDALAFLRTVRPGDFDLIHASPPCQRYSRLPNVRGRDYPDLVGRVRDVLLALGTPYVIENVPGAPLVDPVVLCGAMFGLRTYRHRLFESTVPLLAPPHQPHRVVCPKAGTRGLPPGSFMSVCGDVSQVALAREAMGIDWMSGPELSQAIPPAYTEFIGKQMLGAITT